MAEVSSVDEGDGIFNLSPNQKRV